MQVPSRFDSKEIIFDEADLEPIVITIRMGKRTYLLREALESAHIRYRNAVIRGAKMNDGKVTSIDGVAEADSILLSDCLTEQYEDEKTGKTVEGPVPWSVVKGWKAKIVRPLVKRLKEISDLQDEEDTEEGLTKRLKEIQEKLTKLRAASSNGEAKNESSATTASSV